MTHDATPAATAHPRTSTLRRLRLVGLIGPVVFVVFLISLRPLATAALGWETAHRVLGTVIVLSAAAFGWAMYRLLGQTHAAVVEAERQSAALVERDRIARELHDSLAQVLGVAHLRLRVLEARPAVASDERVRADIDDLATLCREAHRDVREAIIGLKDAHRPEGSFLEKLGAYVAVFSRTSGVPTTLETALDGDLALAPAAEVQLIRVVQEALTNVRKHAGAGRAGVRIAAGANGTEIAIEDDGDGFDPRRTEFPAGSAAGGFGLTTMRERTESIHGRLRIDSAPGRGTRVVVHLPPTPNGSAQPIPAMTGRP